MKKNIVSFRKFNQLNFIFYHYEYNFVFKLFIINFNHKNDLI